MGKIQDILSDPNDAKKCDRLFMLIAERYKDEPSFTAGTEHEQTVLLVWHSFGIIGNGGFHYLLEDNFEGDLGYRQTAKAYSRIGCKSAEICFDRLFSAFPNEELPSDIDERLSRYEEALGGILNELDTAFFAANDEIIRCLAKYIRDNSAAFHHLE